MFEKQLGRRVGWSDSAANAAASGKSKIDTDGTRVDSYLPKRQLSIDAVQS